MIKPILSILMTFLCCSQGFTQDDQLSIRTSEKKSETFKIAPVFGFTTSTLTIEDDDSSTSYQPQVGLAAGFDVVIGLPGNYLDIQTGLIYNEARTRIKSFDSAGTVFSDYQADVQLNRLTVPVLLRIYPAKKQRGLYLQAGMNVHYLLEANIEDRSTRTDFLTNSVESTSDNSRISQKNGLKSVAADFATGVGYGRRVSNSFSFFTQFTLGIGLTSIANQGTLKSHSGLISAGLTFW